MFILISHFQRPWILCNFKDLVSINFHKVVAIYEGIIIANHHKLSVLYEWKHESFLLYAHFGCL